MTVTGSEPTAGSRDTDRPAWPWLVLTVFGVTLLWALRFTVAYLLVPTACLEGAWLLHLVGVVALLGSVAVLFVNVVWARRPSSTPVRFLLLVGLALNTFFLAVIALESSAVLVVDACAKGAIP